MLGVGCGICGRVGSKMLTKVEIANCTLVSVN